MIGQTIIGRFAGDTPPASFLDQIDAGELGGVILFAENVAGGENQTRQLDAQLQRAAKRGGNPPLLIMTDQEGGEVKRLAWAPPLRAPAEMGSSAVAQAEGEAAGKALRAVGINIDLAPVADTVHVPDSFLHTRSFGSEPLLVAERACGFAAGLASAGVGFTLKHFPGLGRALTSTDVQPTTVAASMSALRSDYQPYLACGASPDALVMVSSAIYPSLTGTSTPAVLSPEIYKVELPFATGGRPLTISDDLQAAALAGDADVGQRALNAGLDILLYAQTAEASLDAFQSVLAAAESGAVKRARIEQAYQAVEALKQRVAGATPPAAGASSTATASAAQVGSDPESGGVSATVNREAQPESEARPEG
ncbi:MAG TPA: glycoside hydrolase family 3 N-terminal domain-containing protein [Solirubrobacteraceae bacterium]|jgi:beta-N-acetylhexosaminidase